MSGRSRMISLMAQREAADLADSRRSFAAMVKQRQAADHLNQRLTQIMDSRREQIAASTISVAQLREHRRLSEQLAAEAERNRQRAAQLADEVDRAAAEMARKDHRKRVLDDAARAARRTEAEAREARAEAAMPPRARR